MCSDRCRSGDVTPLRSPDSERSVCTPGHLGGAFLRPRRPPPAPSFQSQGRPPSSPGGPWPSAPAGLVGTGTRADVGGGEHPCDDLGQVLGCETLLGSLSQEGVRRKETRRKDRINCERFP